MSNGVIVLLVLVVVALLLLVAERLEFLSVFRRKR
jgi:hypothetical protein